MTDQQNSLFAAHLANRIDQMSQPAFVEGLTYWQNKESSQQISGDLVLNAVRPVGGAHILICDFSGLGLSAAVAALPVAEMFYQMTSKGYALSDIVRDINSKLHFILPQGFFLFGLCHVINRRK